MSFAQNSTDIPVWAGFKWELFQLLLHVKSLYCQEPAGLHCGGLLQPAAEQITPVVTGCMRVQTCMLTHTHTQILGFSWNCMGTACAWHTADCSWCCGGPRHSWVTGWEVKWESGLQFRATGQKRVTRQQGGCRDVNPENLFISVFLWVQG